MEVVSNTAPDPIYKNSEAAEALNQVLHVLKGFDKNTQKRILDTAVVFFEIEKKQ